jgi:putative ABC transport system permease protein
MSKLDILLMAWQNLLRRKVRTALTVLGVLIGTTSIVVMISLGIGLKESITANMAQWGSLNEITINSYVRFDEEGNPLGDSKALNDDAVEELWTLAGVSGVTPGYEVSGEALWGKKEGYLNLVGLDPGQMKNFEFEAYKGRLLEDADRFNIVLGGQVGYNFYDPNKPYNPNDEVPWEDRHKDEYNPTVKMVGERLILNARNYTTGKSRKFNFNVVGVIDPTRMDKSWSAYVPLEELKDIRKFTKAGSTSAKTSKPKPGEPKGPSPDDYDFIWVKSESIDRTKELSQEIRDMGYSAYSMADNLEGIEEMSKTIQAVLGGIGAITLLVAAIGIINTMIMSIYERTREIGVMKVIGATFSDVRLLFLTEAGLIGLAGGIAGLGLSYSLSFVVNKFAGGMFDNGMGGGQDMAISLIPLWLALFSLVFSFFIGLLAGIYPANRAVKISPIEAIRTS